MKERLISSAILLLMAACSPTGDVTVKDQQSLAETVAEVVADIKVAEIAIEETIVVDILPPFEIADLGEETTFLECLPGEGCFLDGCNENGDCQSGWCVQHLGESVCSQACQEECPPGWSCKQVAGTDPDVVYICVSNYANLCRPCSSNGDCMSTGGAQDACLEYGPDGDFCGGSCGEGGECPWGFTCAEI